MSAWKVVVRRLYDRGGTATTRQIDDGSLPFDPLPSLLQARNLGLASSTGRHGLRGATHSLTHKGVLWCEGKLRDVRGDGTAKSRKSLGFIATWLRALPETVCLPNPAQMPLFDEQW